MTDRLSSRSGVGTAAAGRVRARTLVMIRWIAVTGQAAAILIVYYGLGFELPIDLAMTAVMGSAALNLVLTWLAGRRPQLSDGEASVYLAFDILQLSLLLQLTGGLLNPFSVLLLGPVAIAAITLSRTRLFALWFLAVFCVSVLAVWHLPLPWLGPPPLLSPFYELGLWVALVLGASVIAAYGWRAAEDTRRLANALDAARMSLEREHRLSELGALAAAAAHELGSPLSTIAVVAKELVRDLPEEAPQDLRDDIRLLLDQSERCRDILASLSRLPQPSGGYMAEKEQPISALVEEAVKPHRTASITVAQSAEARDRSPEPLLPRQPEFLHGIGNLVQNAIQFARQKVDVDIRWSEDAVDVVILDDGPGFPPAALGRIGEPYFSSRRGDGEHLGLGIFIAETLVGRTGGRIVFDNRPTGGGLVRVTWPRARLEALS